MILPYSFAILCFFLFFLDETMRADELTYNTHNSENMVKRDSMEEAAWQMYKQQENLRKYYENQIF